jgi:GDP/UDP-N,N'-diacetylbacillosamine 2-epimerase (hydrolysing)
MNKKICVVTGTRAEYGLFYPLIKRLEKEDMFDLQLVATGMHLSPEFGLTYKEIEKDGFIIDSKVEMLLSSDSESGISKSIGIGILSFADVFEHSRPDLLIVLGDRFETFAAAVAAFIARIPVAHLHGGEVTEGVIDDSLRHSITKMAYLHFTSAELFRQRVIQLGESPDRVFNVGALGIDNIKTIQLLSREELEERLNFTFGQQTALITYHPVTLESGTSEQHMREILSALDEFNDLKIIFTHPNADTDGRVIIRLIDEYVARNPEKARSFSSLGKLKYLSAMKHVDLVAGNSSSGIIETPSFQKPVVNIGDRQKGRMKAESIIDCAPARDDIVSAIKRGLSVEFQNACRKVANPYGDGSAAERIVDILKIELAKKIKLKKGFFDLNQIMNTGHFITHRESTGEADARKRSLSC